MITDVRTPIALDIFLAIMGLAPVCAGQDDGPDVPTCGTATFPFEAITKPGDCDAEAPDPAIAVSHDRMIVLTNCGGKIYCKEGAPKTSSLVPLSGTNLSTCVFQLTPDLDYADPHEHFDSRVIWDPYDDRFWIVSAEKGFINVDEAAKWNGRLHIAVSSSGAPDSFSTNTWTKYTSGGVRDAINVSALPNSLPSLGYGFPDRPSIMVDNTYLFITMKQAHPEIGNSHFFDVGSLMLVLKKAEIIAGNSHANDVETSQFIDSAGAGGTWAHELATEQDAYVYPKDEHRVYTITLPGLYDVSTWDGTHYDSLDFGAFRRTGTQWTFTHAPISLATAQKFRAAYGGVVPGDDQPNGDKNIVNPLIWSAAVRSVNGTRKICTIHDCRPDSDSDTDGIIQYYVITPNNYPSGTPTKTVGRYNPTYGWAHDSGIAMSPCGDLAIAYTRSGKNNNNQGIFPQFWSWLIPWNATGTKALVQAGPNQYLEGNGWGDFNQVAEDPSDPTHFFAHHNLVHNDTTCGCTHHSTWAGWAGQFTISGCPFGRDDGSGQDNGLSGFLAFLDAANAGDPAADLDGDGEITVLDYLMARGRFASGG